MPLTLQPRVGGGVLAFGERVEQVTIQFVEAGVVEAPHHRQETRLVRRDLQVGGAEQERLITLVGAAVEQVGCFSVGAGDDDAGHPHDVELEPGGVESFDLLVRRHQNFAALVSTLLGAGALVLDVVSGHAGLDEPLDQVAHVRVSAVPGVRVGDDERPVVHRGGDFTLLGGHAQAQVLLVAVGGQQRTDQTGGFVGHLAEWIAGQVGSGIFVDGALGRGGPPAEVDALDAHSLHGHGLAGRIRAEGGDALALSEQLTQPRVEGLGGLPRDDVVGGNGAALLRDLAGGIQPGDAIEAWSVEILLGGGYVALEAVVRALFELCLRPCIHFDGRHDCPAPYNRLIADLSDDSQVYGCGARRSFESRDLLLHTAAAGIHATSRD